MSNTSRPLPWTDEEYGYVLNTLDEPARVVAKNLPNRSRSSIYALRYAIKHKGRKPVEGWWSESEDQIIRASRHIPTGKLAQMLPGRSEGSVKNRRRRLGAKAVVSHWEADPRVIGARPLVAMSCSKCGRLLPGAWFRFRQDKKLWMHECKSCASATGTSNGASRRARKGDAAREYERKAQQITLERATRNGFSWTDKDLPILSDPSLTVLEKALSLGRTYQGTSTKVNQLGYKSNPALGDSENDQWIIDNPNLARMDAITASLYPESATTAPSRAKWDWDDEDVA